MSQTTQRQVCFVPPERTIALAEKPRRVWTLISETNEDPNVVPELPIEPHHLKNAFLEDQWHDWTWKNGILRYFSRVACHSVWILVEY